MDQDETWHAGIGLGPGHTVLDGDPALPSSPQFLAHVCYGAMSCYGERAGWIKMPLAREVDLGSGHIVLHGDSAPCPMEHRPNFRPMCVVTKRLDGSIWHLVGR